MSEELDVSIVVPVYNAAEYLSEALDSIFGQTYLQKGSCELVVVNDGSTDSSLSILEEYRQKSTIPMNIVNFTSNQGIVSALNAALTLCRGRMIARMDADDICTPDRLDRQRAFLDEHPQVDVVGGPVLMFKHGTKLVKKVDAPFGVCASVDMFFYCAIAHPTVLARREFFSRFSYEQDYAVAEDYRLWLRSLVESDFILANLPPPHVLRLRKHSQNESKSRSDLQMARARMALAKALESVFTSTHVSPPVDCSVLAEHMFYDKMPSDPVVLCALAETLQSIEKFLLLSRGHKLSTAEISELKSHVTSRLGAYAAHELKLLGLPPSECPTWRLWLSRSPSSQWFNLVTSIQSPSSEPPPRSSKSKAPARTDKVTVICFSKDRAFQLKEYLRTLLLFCSGKSLILDIRVLWKASSPEFRQSYTMLGDQFPAVTFCEEINFSQQLLNLVDSKSGCSDWILWGVDDVLWYRSADVHEAMKLMADDESILTTHFRLSPNISFCHPSNAHSVRPPFEEVPGSKLFLKYDRSKATEDWNYPFELCATLMRREDVISTLESIRVWFGEDALSHPNKLEVSGARLFAKKLHEKHEHFTCLCVNQPVLSVITINRVQDVCENRVYEEGEFDLETLDRLFRTGREFDLDYYRSKTFDAVHIGDCVILPN